MQKEKYFGWINGIKGIACVMVFVHHFLVAFYPATYYGESSGNTGLQSWFAQSPIGVVTNGNFLVCLFLTISGMLLAYRYMDNTIERESVSTGLIKRYFQLMIPVLLTSIIVFIIHKTGAFYHLRAAEITKSPWLARYYTESPSLARLLKSAFVTTWFSGDDLISTAFWMLTHVFYGSFIAILCGLMSWGKNKGIIVIYIMLGAAFLITGKDFIYLACFPAGALLAVVMKNREANIKYLRKASTLMGILFLALGLLYGGYPTYIEPTNVYRRLPVLALNDASAQFAHILASFLFLSGVLLLKPVQSFFELKIWQRLGDISYAVYLLHIPILFSFSTCIFLATGKNWNYNGAVLLAFALTALFLFVTAYLFWIFLEKPLVRLVEQRLLKQLSRGDAKEPIVQYNHKQRLNND